MAKSRRTSTPELKAEAVRRIADLGKSPAKVAGELDLGESMLRVREQAHTAAVDQASPGKGNSSAQDEESRRPRPEV